MQHAEQLIQELKAGKPAAQQQVFELYAPRMLALCMRYCTSADDARDAMQDGFVKIFLTASKFKENSALETWMSRIMINTAIDRYKAGLKYHWVEDQEKMERIDETDEENLVEDGEKLSEAELLDIIRQLPDGYRMVFNLYAFEQYTHKQIAEQLNISEGTSKSQLARARKHLQALVREKLLKKQMA